MSAGRPGDVLPLPVALTDAETNVDPFAWLRERRAESALRWDDHRGCWDAFTYEAVERIVSDAETFSNEAIVGQNVVFKDTLLGMDPPEHTEMRSLVDEYFSPAAVRGYEPDIRASAERLLDETFDEEAGTVDVVSAVGFPLPVETIGHVLGASAEVREELKAASDRTIRGFQLSDVDDPEEFLREQGDAVFGVGKLANTVIQANRAEPGDGLVADLLAADRSHYELVRLCGLLLVAGHVTTTNLLAGMVRSLAEHPDAMATVRTAARDRDTDLLDRTVEEAVRYRSPAQFAMRVATEPVTVAGHDIQAGDPLVAWLQAANRDPAVFDDPDTFDPTREHNPNIAFGRGPHTCLGAHLARLEGRVFLEALFDRVETLELVDTDYDPVQAAFLNGVEELPVRYERAER